MWILQVVLIITTLLCALVAGLVFAFASVVMPGIGMMEDREFLRAFKVIDRVIQDRQPWFMLIWVGSLFAIIAIAILGMLQTDGASRILIILASLIYIFGVQFPTMTINIPLNNQLQKMDLGTASEAEIQDFRQKFEVPWNRWNRIRTLLASSTAVILMAVLLML